MQIFKKYILFILISLGLLCSFTPQATASSLKGDIFKKTDNIAKESFKTADKGDAAFSRTVARVTNILLGVIGTAAVILLIYAGFLWATAGGNDDKVKKAKKIIIQAIVGIIVASLAYAIVAFVIVRFLGSSLTPDESEDDGGTDDDPESAYIINPIDAPFYELS